MREMPSYRHAVASFLLGAISTMVAHIPRAAAQTVVETQQQANDRIRSLSANTPTPPHDYVIGRGDLMYVEVFDVPELSRELRVSQTGTIGIPLIPVRLFVAGLTEMQAQQKVAEVLAANGLVSNPQVMVSVKEKRSKPITVVGAVAHPMVYHAERPVTLIQVLAEAGGIAADAGDTVIVTRGDSMDSPNANEPPEIGNEDTVPAGNSAPAAAPSAAAQQPPPAEPQADGKQPPSSSSTGLPTAAAKATPETAPAAIVDQEAPPPIANTITVNLAELLERGDTQNNIPLQGGDIVTVPHGGIVYALGAVQKPGGFVSANDRGQFSTLKLLALAGGMTRIAKKDQAVIIRKDATGKQLAIPVDLGKIVNRKSEDVKLMPSDILYIPDSVAKRVLIRSGEIALAIGTATVIYRAGI
jgi:polysaccharide export outer membrane protein